MDRQKLQDLNLLDDFLFTAMISHREVGEPSARILLKIILQKELPSLNVIAQRVYYGSDTDRKGIRIDAYVEELVMDPESGEKADEDPEQEIDTVSDKKKTGSGIRFGSR